MSAKRASTKASKPPKQTIAGVAGQVVCVQSAVRHLHTTFIASAAAYREVTDGLRDRVAALEGEINVLKGAHEQMSRIMVQNADAHRREIRAIVLQSAKVELGPIRAIMLDMRADLELLAHEIKVIEGQDPQS